MIRRLIALVALLVGLSLAATAFFAWRYQTPQFPEDVAAVVVLSAGATPDGRMDAQTSARTLRGIEVWKEVVEAAPDVVLVLSGGGDENRSDPVKAPLMADAAGAAGVPDAAILVEDRSGSTLHNALFSRDLLGERAGGELVLVTHRFHLLRSWASFRWAGMENLTLVPAEAPDEPPVTNGLLMEGIKWPANIARAGLFSLLTWAGVPDEKIVGYLY